MKWRSVKQVGQIETFGGFVFATTIDESGYILASVKLAQVEDEEELADLSWEMTQVLEGRGKVKRMKARWKKVKQIGKFYVTGNCVYAAIVDKRGFAIATTAVAIVADDEELYKLCRTLNSVLQGKAKVEVKDDGDKRAVNQ